MQINNDSVSSAYKRFLKAAPWDFQGLDFSDGAVTVYFVSEGDFVAVEIGECEGTEEGFYRLDMSDVHKLFAQEGGKTLGQISRKSKINFSNDDGLKFVVNCIACGANPVVLSDVGQWAEKKIDLASIASAGRFCGHEYPFNFAYYDTENDASFASNSAAVYRDAKFDKPAFCATRGTIPLIRAMVGKVYIDGACSKVYSNGQDYTGLFSVFAPDEKINEYIDITKGHDLTDPDFTVSPDDLRKALAPHSVYAPKKILMSAVGGECTIRSTDDKDSAIQTSCPCRQPEDGDEAKYQFRWAEISEITKGDEDLCFTKHAKYEEVFIVYSESFVFATI